MFFEVVYKPLAQIEASNAYAWYSQGHIGMGDDFIAELERTNRVPRRAAASGWDVVHQCPTRCR